MVVGNSGLVIYLVAVEQQRLLDVAAHNTRHARRQFARALDNVDSLSLRGCARFDDPRAGLLSPLSFKVGKLLPWTDATALVSEFTRQ